MQNVISASLLLALLCCSTSLLAQEHNSTIANDLHSAPAFVENRGQWDGRARYLVQGSGYDCWIGTTTVLYDVYTIVGDQRRRGATISMEFVGADAKNVATGLDPREGVRNYLYGNDPSGWALNVREYSEVSISHLYHGVDLKLSIESGEPRYDLIVSEGTDPSTVSMRYSGAEKMRVNAAGDLVLTTGYGQVEHRHPIAYQLIGGRQTPVDARFVEHGGGVIGFELGSYDRSQPLVIDPVISSRVFTGGVRDGVYDVAVSNDGRVYLCGWSYSLSYPTTVGSYDRSLNNDSLLSDAVVMKVNGATMALVYSTFIGGSDGDVATGLSLNVANGEVVVCGETRSTDFPTTPNGMQRVHQGGTDAFVLRLVDGGGALAYSTFVGGSRSDRASKVVEDENGRIYFCGATTSQNFPVSPTAAVPAYSSLTAPYYTDAFVAMVDPSNNNYAATYLGGSGTDEATGLTLTRDRNEIVVVGGTWSGNFPQTPDALQPARSGSTPANEDAFIAMVPLTFDALIFSSYLGGSQLDIANSVSLAPSGSVLVCGETQSRNFPATLPFDSSRVKVLAPDLFIAELNFDQRDLNGRPSIVSSVKGGTGSDVAYDIICGRNGERWVVGVSASWDMPTTSNAYQKAHSDSASYDCFMMQFDSASHSMIYNTYLGGDNDDFPFGVTVDQDGDLYVAGATASSNYPVTTEPYEFDVVGKTGGFLTRFVKVAGVVGSTVGKSDAHVAADVWQSGEAVELRFASQDGGMHDVSVGMYDMQGRLVREARALKVGSSSPARIECGQLQSGSYMLRMVVDGRHLITRPLIIVR